MPDANLDHLCPFMRDKAVKFLEQANAACPAGEIVKITTTWRDPAEQNAAQAAGLSKAKAGSSPHNCTLPDGTPWSKAFDFSVIRDGQYVGDGMDAAYARCGAIVEGLGLIWGGTWSLEKTRCKPDYDHAQIPAWRTASGEASS